MITIKNNTIEFTDLVPRVNECKRFDFQWNKEQQGQVGISCESNEKSITELSRANKIKSPFWRTAFISLFALASFWNSVGLSALVDAETMERIKYENARFFPPISPVDPSDYLKIYFAASGEELNEQGGSIIKIEDLVVDRICNYISKDIHLETSELSNLLDDLEDPNPVNLKTTLLREGQLVDLYCNIDEIDESLQIKAISLILNPKPIFLLQPKEDGRKAISFKIGDIEGAEDALNREYTAEVEFSNFFGIAICEIIKHTGIQAIFPLETSQISEEKKSQIIKGFKPDSNTSEPDWFSDFLNSKAKFIPIMLQIEKSNFTNEYELKLYLQRES